MCVNSTFLLPWRCRKHGSIEMHLKIKTCMFEQLSKPLQMDGIQISFLVVACLIYMQNVATSKRGKLITHCFWIKNLFFNEEIQHCCDYFQLDFEGEMSCLIPLCVHEKECE